MRLSIGISFLSLLAAPATAQTDAAVPAGSDVQPARPWSTPPATRAGGPAKGWSITIGAAPVLSPAWQGSRDVALSVFPDLRVNYGDVFFASVPDGVGLNLLRRDGWRAGPLVKIRFGRDEDGRGSPFQVTGGSDALRGMGDVGVAGEAGGFVEKRFGARGVWRVRAEARQGFGGHDGAIADISAARGWRAGQVAGSLGPRATFATGNYLRTYFGVDAGQSLRTGLARYRPGGGLVSVGIGGSAIRPLDRNSAVTLFGGVDYLGDQAGRSPLIEERGRRLQATIGIGYGYRFNL